MVDNTVLLFGGSFDPLHIGHTALAGYMLAYYPEVAEVWFLPTVQNPLKAASTCYSFAERCEAISYALRHQDDMKLCEIEQTLPYPHYTFDTLSALEAAYPNKRFALLIGADSLANLHRWYRAKELVERIRIFVYPRLGFESDAVSHPNIIPCTDAPCIEVSSSQIRQALEEGKDLRYWLPCPEWFDRLKSPLDEYHEKGDA